MVEDFASLTGKGIKGTVQGKTVYVGSTKLFKELLTIDESLERLFIDLQNEGKPS